VYLTGGLRVDGPSGTFVAADLPGGQGRLALAALLIERRPLSRDQLAELVWDGAPPARWTSALHALISKLRALLTAIGLDGRSTLTSLGGSYALTLPADSWIDLENALRRVDRAQGALRRDDARTAAREATVASSILRRPLLAGVDGDWIERQRRRQADAAYQCTIALADAWLRLGDHQLAAVLGDAAVAQDPLREVGHRMLMRAEWARGDRAAALRALARCEQILADELDVAPSPATAELAARIRA
jgi:DNA-binding SARP family transcriptional activator